MNDFGLEGSPKLADHLAALRREANLRSQRYGLDEGSLNKGQAGGQHQVGTL